MHKEEKKAWIAFAAFVAAAIVAAGVLVAAITAAIERAGGVVYMGP